MDAPLYSLRMRAAAGGAHLSGAERIAAGAELPALSAEMVSRALAAGAAPDEISCRIDRLAATLPRLQLPDITTWQLPDWRTARDCARTLLCRAGVSAPAAEAALSWLASGAAPGGAVMRGAMIVDALSGARLEADPARGVRVSRMDLDPAARPTILGALAAAGLGHPRVAEAWVLAGKVLQAPGIVAELCWSDDPHYLNGYVADPCHGYQRLSPLKAAGDPRGGRALFVAAADFDLDSFCTFLEGRPLLFDRAGTIASPRPWSP